MESVIKFSDDIVLFSVDWKYAKEFYSKVDSDKDSYKYLKENYSTSSAETYKKFTELCSTKDCVINHLIMSFGVIIGRVLIKYIDKTTKVGSIECILGSKYTGSKIGTIVCEKAIDYAFHNSDMFIIQAEICELNEHARRAADVIGFACESTLRERMIVDDKRCALSIWSICRKDFVK